MRRCSPWLLLLSGCGFTPVTFPALPPAVEAVNPSTGFVAGGATLAIFGGPFVAGAEVGLIDAAGTQVSCSGATLVSDLQLRCTTPSHPEGVMTVRVRNPDGKQGELADAFTYVAVPPGVEAALALSGPGTLVAGRCSGELIATRLDANGLEAINDHATRLTLRSTGAVGLRFFSDAACTSQVATIDIASNRAEASFWISADDAGDAELRVEGAELGGASWSLTALVDEAVATALYVAGPTELQVAACSAAYDVTLLNGAGNAVTSATATTIALSQSGAATLSFYDDSGCSSAVTNVTVNSGQSEARFYVRASNVGTSAVNVAASDLTGASVNVTALTACAAAQSAVVPLYSAASQWNDYVLNDGGWLASSNVACTGNETTGDPPCLHGGELRRVELTGQLACEGLTLRDALGVFRWTCDDSGGAGEPVRAVSAGFAPGRGLADLLTAASAWRLNRVTATKTGCASPVVTTPDAAWWSNPIVALSPAVHSESAAAFSFSSAAVGVIYTVPASRKTAGYLFGDKSALVTLGDAVLSYNGSTASNCLGQADLLCADGVDFIWIEGRFDARGPTRGTDAEANHLHQVRFARAHEASFLGGIQDSDHAGLHLDEVKYSLVTNLTSTSSRACGLRLTNATYNRLRDVYLADNNSDDVGCANLRLEGSSVGNRFQRLATVAGHRGIGVAVYDTSNDNTFVDVLTAGNHWDGIWLSGDFNGDNVSDLSGITISHVTTVNNAWGIDSEFVTGATFVQTAALHNRFEGIDAEQNDNQQLTHAAVAFNGEEGLDVSNYAGERFDAYGEVRVGHNGYGADWNCEVTYEATVTVDDACFHCASPSGCTTATRDEAPTFVASVGTTFVGKASQDDVSVVADGSGQATRAELQGWTSGGRAGWAAVENRFRAWGAAAGPFPSFGNFGTCTRGRCQLWDFRVAADDEVLRAVHEPFVPGATCPSSLQLVNTDGQATPNTFIATAVELDGDLRGDDDGLCESNEACVYSPNLGAYQGEGSLSEPCRYEGTAVRGVEMRAYLGAAPAALPPRGTCAAGTGLTGQYWTNVPSTDPSGGNHRVFNDSGSAVSFDDIEVRHYFTNEESSSLNETVTSFGRELIADPWWVTEDPVNVYVSYEDLVPARPGADSYVRIRFNSLSFGGNTDQLEPGEYLQLSYYTAPSDYDAPNSSQSDDYSYAYSGAFSTDPTPTGNTSPRATIYIDDELVFGCEP